MKLSYKGKTAIVTGACGGMGLETTKKLLKNNITTLMLDVRTPQKSFLKKNYNVFFKKVDITNYKKLKSIIDDFYNNCAIYIKSGTGSGQLNKITDYV